MNYLHPTLKTTFLLFWLFLFLSCQHTSKESQQQKDLYQVIAIKDGDTIEILKDGKPLRIRIQGVDCPEKKQDFGTKAQQFTSDLVFGKRVKLVVHGQDRYRRTVGEIVLPDGRNLGNELVKYGFAWHYKAYSKDPELARLELEARAAKRGLWAGPSPVAPWDYRRPKNKQATFAKTASKPAPTIINKNGPAYICMSKSAATYHLNPTCHLLKRCKSAISAVTQAKAKSQNRTPCKVCAQ